MRKIFILFIPMVMFGTTLIHLPEPQRGKIKGAKPNTRIKSHDRGNMKLVISNWGFFGNAGEYSQYMWSCEYPANSHEDYLFQGALWIGALMTDSLGNVDTLVTVGADGWQWENEMFPGSADSDTIIERSIDKSSPYYDSINAVSEQDYVAEYTDTIGVPYAPGSHHPMGLSVKQESYQWSYSYAQDFIILKFTVKNMNKQGKSLKKMYVGLYIDGDCHPVSSDPAVGWNGAQDDVTGFRRWADESDTLWPAGTKLYHYNDTTGHYKEQDVGNTPKYQDPGSYINTAWLADGDGFNDARSGGPSLNPSVTGSRILYPPPDNIIFNWWFSDPDASKDWGPGGLMGDQFGGTPSSPLVSRPDIAKYWILSDTTASGGFDPDQVGPNGVNAKWPGGWPSGVDSINDTRYLISFGPYNLAYGDSINLIVGYVGGENFHPTNVIGQYDFSDFALNSSWAYKVYDNPGRYSDTLPPPAGVDSCKGDYVVIPPDTAKRYITGDGIPDYAGPIPPPAPDLIVKPRDKYLDLYWDKKSENALDPFIYLQTNDSSIAKDFEGYRIYLSETGQSQDFTTIAEFDKVDFDTAVSADSSDTAISPIGRNRGMPSETTLVVDGDTGTYYHYALGPFLDFYPKYISVTSFDRGYYIVSYDESTKTLKRDYKVDPLESNPIVNTIFATPQPSDTMIYRGDSLNVYVVPNPYFIDANYQDIRWEDWEQAGWTEHKRKLIFVNLPRHAKIKIYSLSGDIIDEIDHTGDAGIGKAESNYEAWNLITKDAIGIVSGIYLFSVKDLDTGKKQIGKFVIIK